MVNANFPTSVLAGTFNTYMRNKATDNIFGDLPLIRWLSKNGKIRKDGGIKILEPLLYRKSTAQGSYSGYDILDTTPQETITNAEFDWKQYYLSVTIDGRTKLLNTGRARMVNVLDAKIHQAKTSLIDAMNTDLFSDGLGNSSKALTGLAAMVLGSGTYGNIVRSTDTWWKANVQAVSGALAITGATGMRRMYNDCSLGRGLMTPDLLLTTQILYEAYEATMDSNMRFANTDKSPVIEGFDLKFKRASVVWDDACQSGVMYFLNSKVMNLVVHAERDAGDADKDENGYPKGDFRLEPWKSPINQDAETAQAYWMGNLTANNCRHLGKLTGLTNT